MTFAAYISCFCVEFSFDLVTFTFNLLTLAMSDELSFTYVQCTYQCLASYYHQFLSYVWLNLITWPSPGMVTAHTPCHLTYHGGGGGQKWSTFFEIPEPSLPIHFVTFTALRRRFSNVICEKYRFPLWRLQSLLHMRSITWPVHMGSP